MHARAVPKHKPRGQLWSGSLPVGQTGVLRYRRLWGDHTATQTAGDKPAQPKARQLVRAALVTVTAPTDHACRFTNGGMRRLARRD